MSYDDARAAYGDEWDEDDPSLAFSPGGETWADFHARVDTSLRRLAAEHEDRTLVVACHGGVVDVALRALLDLPMVGGFEVYTHNTSLTEFVRVPARERRTSRWRLVRYNDTAHLAGVS